MFQVNMLQVMFIYVFNLFAIKSTFYKNKLYSTFTAAVISFLGFQVVTRFCFCFMKELIVRVWVHSDPFGLSTLDQRLLYSVRLLTQCYYDQLPDH